ncbi:MAG: hypothetical protein ABEJ05_04185 [Haloglomus sp.]
MRQYVSPRYERGYARSVPDWRAVLLVLTVFASTLAAGVVLTATPALGAGLVGGILLRRVVVSGYRASHRVTARAHRTADRLTGFRARQVTGGR